MTVVLDAVDEGLRMFGADAECEALGLQRPAARIEQFVEFSGGMAGSQDHIGGLVG